MSHSKGKETEYDGLSIQKYLKSDKLTTSQKTLLHQLRFKMIRVRANFRHMYNNDVKCLLCGEEETTEHILNCLKLIDNCPSLYHDNVVQFQDIYSEDLEKQIRVTKLYEKVLIVREELLTEREGTTDTV